MPDPKNATHYHKCARCGGVGILYLRIPKPAEREWIDAVCQVDGRSIERGVPTVPCGSCGEPIRSFDLTFDSIVKIEGKES